MQWRCHKWGFMIERSEVTSEAVNISKSDGWWWLEWAWKITKVWRMKGSVNYNGGNVVVWVCMVSSGRGSLITAEDGAHDGGTKMTAWSFIMQESRAKKETEGRGCSKCITQEECRSWVMSGSQAWYSYCKQTVPNRKSYSWFEVVHQAQMWKPGNGS